jgi:3-oxoacyl-[acyl-carrier protein] reductase
MLTRCFKTLFSIRKVAIVTGASKGIGAGIATALRAAGARVAVNYSSDRLGAERLTQAIIDSGGEAVAIGADVSKAADVAQLFDKVDSAFGRLDVLVNNAGVFRFGAFAEITEESFHLHYNINVLGTILTAQEAIKRFGATAVASSTSAPLWARIPWRETCCMRPRKAPSKH